VLLLPVAVLVALMERRFRAAAAGVAAFGVVTVAINLPVALEPAHGGGFVFRKGWTWFFQYNEKRPPEISVYHYLSPSDLGTAGVNRVSAIALGAIVVALLLVTARRFAAERSRSVLVPAFGAAMLGFLFVNKVYSPQYTLWVMAVLALLGAPLALAAAFAAVDLFATYVGFHQFSIHTQPTHHDYIIGVLDPVGAAREVLLFGVLVWCVVRVVRRRPQGSDPRAPAAGELAPA
jgi:hypothetical protein